MQPRRCLCFSYLLFLAASVESTMEHAKYKCVSVYHVSTTYCGCKPADTNAQLTLLSD
jgi:hypothetical protein